MLSEEIWELWLVILTKIWLWEGKICLQILLFYHITLCESFLCFGSILHVNSFWYWFWVLQWTYNHFSLYGRNHRAPRTRSKDFTLQIEIETISIILLVVTGWDTKCKLLPTVFILQTQWTSVEWQPGLQRTSVPLFIKGSATGLVAQGHGNVAVQKGSLVAHWLCAFQTI